MEKLSYTQQFIKRLGSETPKFFKKIITFAIALGGLGLAILGIKETDLPIPIPEIVKSIAGYMVVAGTVAGVVAKTTTTNPPLQEQGGSLARTPRT